ncbi:MFS transporter [Rhizobium sp. 11515TR]|uniref:MFS transporter n=1 Tax=Rhizobium sp. 11515TR TaxID=2028343 RepID=UPI000BA86171|nr:MFS transporter [Rhizobium sp. 11515TR]ASW09928.1 hypothetical protein CKA34_28345 [Rhizobium sp. 11515TR]
MPFGAFNPARQGLATCLIFCLAGICLGAWAPLVPIVKQRLQIDEGMLSLLLLCMGAGSIMAMPFTAYLTSRSASRHIIPAAVMGLMAIVPVLATVDNAPSMCIALFSFGMCMGTNSVAMNLQAVFVENDAGKPLMSGFHVMFSLGGIVGSAIVTILLGGGVAAGSAALVVSGTVGILLLCSISGLLPHRGIRGARAPTFASPKGIVLVLGLLSLLAMLAEGGVLDWGALFLIESHGISLTLAGFGYTGFTAAMMCGRLCGNIIRSRYGDQAVLSGSATLACFGFGVSLLIPNNIAVIMGFILVGAGLANVVPILFTLTGKTKVMPPNMAVSAVLSVGYTGIIIGPALLGLVAHATNVQVAFVLLCCAMAIVAAAAKRVYLSVLGS